MRLLLFIAVLVQSALAFAAPPLLAPAELNALLGAPIVRVIDIRDADAYAAKHVPGALSAPYGTWRGPATNPGELPALPELTKRVQSLGLAPDMHAVVVSDGDGASDFGAAARVYWTLKVLGMKELSILNGGMVAWAAAKFPEDSAPASVAASTWQPAIDLSLVATRDDVAKAVASGNTKLIDARPASFYRGETRVPAAKAAGTIKGAVNVDSTVWFKPGSGAFVSVDEAKGVGMGLPLSGSGETITFCNTGQLAATDWFALSEVMGQPNVRLYPGSLVDWTQSPAPPAMDNVPSRAGQLAIDWKLWWARHFN